MATPSPTSSPPSDSSPSFAATSPQKNPQPSTSSQSQNTPVALAASTSSAVARKSQPVLWTQDETLLLIESHKDKCYSSEIRSFAERVMVMEKKKMEFAEETVKLRKEMEIKRVKLIQSSHAQLLQALNTLLS
ncbi:uncharacterized protein LOC103838020 [Brassica rapa]|uniref:uncharacterized protein LOC103838020 n=1 Tax=Brassica campestris TaxID=3711 RepID=UPI0004F1D491|nr:uncharacterized protein LOC103838020 [Brassica rapa]